MEIHKTLSPSIDLSHCFIDIKDKRNLKKRFSRFGRIKSIIIIAVANKNGSTRYIPTVKDCKIKNTKKVRKQALEVKADSMYNIVKIRKNNREREIKSNIPVIQDIKKKRK